MDFLPLWPFSLNTLFFFGVLLYCGALGGYFAHRWPWLPSITGFMIVGFIAGPNGLQLISYEGLTQTRAVVDIALALILYRLGLSLDLKRIRQDRSIMLISLFESALTFALVYVAMGFVGLAGLPAAVVATVAISSSPAVLIHVAHEMGASGPVTSRAMTLVALNNVIAFVAFAGVLPALYVSTDAPMSAIAGAPLYRLIGSAALGMAFGLALHFAARRMKGAGQYHLALVIGAVMMTVGAAMFLKLSALFAPLVLGLVVRSLEREQLVADLEFGPSFELFFIVLFVYAGANLHLAEMVHYWPAALAFVGARCAAKWVGVTGTGYALGAGFKQASSTGLLLLPMAGLAIGLANTTVALFPASGVIVSSVVLAAVAILETLGPPVASRALRWSGDRLDDSRDPANDATPLYTMETSEWHPPRASAPAQPAASAAPASPAPPTPTPPAAP
ncbi:MAG: cation:proton antiporter [Burkholderiaceae bacterium]|nr:cation:proton antiporter [Burkholderiaceae bacterium]